MRVDRIQQTRDLQMPPDGLLPVARPETAASRPGPATAIARASSDDTPCIAATARAMCHSNSDQDGGALVGAASSRARNLSGSAQRTATWLSGGSCIDPHDADFDAALGARPTEPP